MFYSITLGVHEFRFLWNQSTVSSFSKETRSGGAVYIFKSEMCLIEINCLNLSCQKCVVICTRVRQKCEKVVISFELLNLRKQNLVLLIVSTFLVFKNWEDKFFLILLPIPVLLPLLMTWYVHFCYWFCTSNIILAYWIVL